MVRVWLLAAVTVAAPASADYMDHFVVREDVGIHKAPYLGPAELVILPVEVAGRPPINFERLLRFVSSDNPDGMVKYLHTASLGRYRPRIWVAPRVRYETCPLPAAAFPNCSVARGDFAAFSAGIDLIREVVRRTNTENEGFDFAARDVNGRRAVADGWVDGVMLLTNLEFGGIAFPFGYYNRGDNLDGGSGGPLVVDGVKIGHVAIAGYDDMFTMVHEFGHLLGLTDLYAENRSYPGLQFSLMGAWGYDDKIPLHDAESRFRLRWANWHQVQGRQRVRIGPAETTGEVWRLGAGEEYFLVENRGPDGQFDRSFTHRGLAVYHVDRRVKLRGEEGRFQDRILDCVNCDRFHPYIRNVQADGRFDLQQPQGAVSFEDDLFRDGDSLREDASHLPLSEAHQVSSSNWYSGQASGISISDIQLGSDGTVVVTLEAPSSGQCGDSLCGEGEGCLPVTCENPGPWAAGGCGCSSGPWQPLLMGLLFVVFWRRRLPARQG